MKKFFVSIIAVFLFSQTALAQLEDDWAISSFNATITVEEDSTVLVTETITADFSQTSKRGIIREIPYKYLTDAGKRITLDTKILNVTDENNQPLEYLETRQGDFINIRIGNVDVFYSEPLTYKIRYDVKGAINFFEQNDEIFWNVTGNDWPVPIYESTASVGIPSGATDKNTKFICYTGTYGSTDQNCTLNKQSNESYSFVSNNQLNPGEGLTIALAFDKGLVSKPPMSLKEILNLVAIGIPPLLFIFLFAHWIKIGRDPRGRGTIMPMYKPPLELTPTEIGTIIDEKIQTKDITVAIIDLAIRGFIEIRESKDTGLIFNSKDVTLIKKKDVDLNLPEFERILLNQLFASGSEVQMSDLSQKFYEHIKDIKDAIYHKVTKDGYFSKNPKLVRTTYLSLGSGLLFIPMFTAGFLPFISIVIFGVIVACGLILMIFAPLMPQKTIKGVKTTEHILGFKEFVKTAEEDRLNTLQQLRASDAKNGIQTFEKLLPYAIVLGVGEKWAKVFKNIYKEAGQTPIWYTGYGGDFDALRLNNRLNSINSIATRTLTSRPSSAASGGSGFGGGGFSGGGFGGGGGGSW